MQLARVNTPITFQVYSHTFRKEKKMRETVRARKDIFS